MEYLHQGDPFSSDQIQVILTLIAKVMDMVSIFRSKRLIDFNATLILHSRDLWMTFWPQRLSFRDNRRTLGTRWLNVRYKAFHLAKINYRQWYGRLYCYGFCWTYQRPDLYGSYCYGSTCLFWYSLKAGFQSQLLFSFQSAFLIRNFLVVLGIFLVITCLLGLSCKAVFQS